MNSSYNNIIRIVISIVVGVGSYYLAVKITNSLNILITGAWSWLANILLFPLYLIYFIPIISLIFVFSWNVINYALIKSNIIKEEVEKESLISKPSTIMTVVKNTLIWTTISIVTLYLLQFSLMSRLGNSMAKTMNKNYEKSFHTTSYTNDFNDSRIIFYKSEIEKSSKAYIDANNDYALFKAFTQKEIGLKCIRVLLTKHTNSNNVYKLSSAFDKNSRNKYAQTKSLIAKYRNNDNRFKNREGYYRSNIVDPFSRFLDTNMPNSCEKKVPVEKMYRLFLPEYIEKREIEIANYQTGLTSNNSNYINKKIDDLTSRIDSIRVNEGI